jgi:hypothetical protein
MFSGSLYEGDEKRAGKENLRHDFPSRQRTLSSCGKTRDTFRKLGFEILGHPAYSPDFAACGFCLFKILKNVLREKHKDVDELSYAVQCAISEINGVSYFNSFLHFLSRGIFQEGLGACFE